MTNINNNKELKEQYSADPGHVKNIQQDTQHLYSINVILMIVYYFLLILFVANIFTNVRESPFWIKKTLFIVLLFLYPILIFPIQYGLYHGFRKISDSFFQNIYLSKTW